MKTKTIILLALLAAIAANFRALAEPDHPQRFNVGAVPEGLNASDWASIRQQAYLKASNTEENDAVFAVAVSGDTVVIGAYNERSSATGVNGDQSDNSAENSGAAYVFVRNGSNWTQQAYLKASNTDAGDLFSDFAVAISGDTIVVGAFRESSKAIGINGDQSDNNALRSGAAYVFVRDGTNWSQQAYLKASNTGAGDLFGISVAVSGDTVVIGAHHEESSATGVNGDESDNMAPNSGAAYVFLRSGTNWSQQAYLKASNTEAFDQFGDSVSVSGDTILVGANFESSSATGVNGDQADNNAPNSGAAYVFVRNGTNWSQQAYLKASNTTAGDQFGFQQVAVSGDTAVVGAWMENGGATGVNGDQSDTSADNSGAAYVFVRSGTNWSQQAYLKASNTGAGDILGRSVALSGDIVVVGAARESSNATGVNGDQGDNSATWSGAVYVFVRRGTNWVQQAYLKASNTGADDRFGPYLGVSGDTIVVSAPNEDSNAIGVNGDGNNDDAGNSGAAYVFTGHALAAAGNLAVDSQTRGNDTNDTYGDWSIQNLEWGAGYPTVNVTVDTDEWIEYPNGMQRQGLIDNLLTVGSQENDNPAFTSIYGSALHFGWIVADDGAISIAYDLSFATRLVDIMLFDVDEGDVARVEILGADGQSVPPSELEFVMEGDLSRYYNNPNRPQSEAATPPSWDDSTGTLTARVSWNENRSFTILRPKVPVRQITIIHTGTRASVDRAVAPFVGSHILTALWATPREFKITEFKRISSDSFQLTWPSLPGLAYEILGSSDFQTWDVVATVWGAESPAVESSWAVGDAIGRGQFYRIRNP